MLTLKELKKDLEKLPKLTELRKRAKKNLNIKMFIAYLCALPMSIYLMEKVFVESIFMTVMFSILCSMILLFFYIISFNIRENNTKFKGYSCKELYYSDFYLFNKKDIKKIKEEIENYNPKIQKYFKTESIMSIEHIYLKLVKEEEFNTLMSNLKLIFEDINYNQYYNLKKEILNYVLQNINEKLFNQYREEIVFIIENYFDTSVQISYLQAMKELSLKYDNEIINKEKEELKKEIFKNYKPLEINKGVISI